MILLFAGTAEGREIFFLLRERGYPVVATVTTPYGAQALAEEDLAEKAKVYKCVLDAGEMVSLIRKSGIQAVIDASHPFATRVSRNALEACRITGIRYIRYERPASTLPEHPLIYPCRDFHQAAQKAVSFGETIFLTTGSKTLPIFVEEAQKHGKRVVTRILPDPQALVRCFALGLQPADIIAMQGPFDYELNRALLRQYRASVLVTKESGPAGGTEQKVKAAVDLGIPVVLIKRPVKEYPLEVSSYEDLLKVLET